MIRYTAEQLLNVNRSMAFVPTIFYSRPEGNPEFRFGKLSVLNDNIKRVYLVARHIHTEKKPYTDRNSWVILLETVTGKGMSVELCQIDRTGNTIVMVRPRLIQLVDQPGTLQHGQISGFAYTKYAELTVQFSVANFLNRVEVFGLSRHQLRRNTWHDEEGEVICDFRGKFIPLRIYVRLCLTRNMPEMYRCDYRPSLLDLVCSADHRA